MVKNGVDIITLEKLVDASESYPKTKTPAGYKSAKVSPLVNSLQLVSMLVRVSSSKHFKFELLHRHSIISIILFTSTAQKSHLSSQH